LLAFHPPSASLRLFKAESGLNGLLPAARVPSIYSVSALSRLRSALKSNCILRPVAVRSFLAPSGQTQNVRGKPLA